MSDFEDYNEEDDAIDEALMGSADDASDAIEAEEAGVPAQAPVVRYRCAKCGAKRATINDLQDHYKSTHREHISASACEYLKIKEGSNG